MNNKYTIEQLKVLKKDLQIITFILEICTNTIELSIDMQESTDEYLFTNLARNLEDARERITDILKEIYNDNE